MFLSFGWRKENRKAIICQFEFYQIYHPLGITHFSVHPFPAMSILLVAERQMCNRTSSFECMSPFHNAFFSNTNQLIRILSEEKLKSNHDKLTNVPFWCHCSAVANLRGSYFWRLPAVHFHACASWYRKGQCNVGLFIAGTLAAMAQLIEMSMNAP